MSGLKGSENISCAAGFDEVRAHWLHAISGPQREPGPVEFPPSNGYETQRNDQQSLSAHDAK
jgi:hypothetical protein